MSGSSIQGFKTVSYLQSGSKAEKPRRVWGMGSRDWLQQKVILPSSPEGHMEKME